MPFNPYGVQKDLGFSRFSTMPFDMAFDKISIEAKGLFFQLTTLPDDWNYTAKGMATICLCGVDKINRCMKELESVHRIIRLRYRNEKGQLSSIVPMIISEPDRIEETIAVARKQGFEVDGKIARATKRISVENPEQPLSQATVENSIGNGNGGKHPNHDIAKPQVTPSTGFSSTGLPSTGFSGSILNTTNSKYSTTASSESDPRLGQCGTAIAEPVVSSPTAPSSDVGLGSEEKNEEATLEHNAVDAAFAALEARSLRRTTSPASKAAAKVSYRKLVAEGHSPDDIDAAYSNYVRWVESDNVKNKMGLASWLVDENGFTRNNDEVKAKRAAAEKRGSAAQTANPSTAGEVDDAEYRRRCQAVGMIDDDAEYRVEFAEQSDDEHLRRLAALVRAEKPVTLGNGLIDERLSRRPTYLNLWSRTNRKEHHRDYVLWCYQQLKTEGKVR